MNKFILGSLLILFSSAIVAPATRAEKTDENPATETRTEDVQQSVETESLKTEESVKDFEEKSEVEPQTRTEDVQENIEEIEENSLNSSSSETDPFEFVTSAYQGQYEEQGIPGFETLSSAYSSGELTAEKLVMIGVEKGILNSEMMDEGYVSDVDSQLESLLENE